MDVRKTQRMKCSIETVEERRKKERKKKGGRVIKRFWRVQRKREKKKGETCQREEVKRMRELKEEFLKNKDFFR